VLVIDGEDHFVLEGMFVCVDLVYCCMVCNDGLDIVFVFIVFVLRLSGYELMEWV